MTAAPATGASQPHRAGAWVAADWYRRYRAKQLPLRSVGAALRADRRLLASYVLAALFAGFVVAAWFVDAVPLLATAALALVGSGLTALTSQVVARLRAADTEAYLASVRDGVTALLATEIADGFAEVLLGRLRRAGAVLVNRHAGPHLIVAAYPLRPEVYVAIGAFVVPLVQPEDALALVEATARRDFSVLPGRLLRRGQPTWLVVTTADGRRHRAHRRRHVAPAAPRASLASTM
jgi:hypothetical protein